MQKNTNGFMGAVLITILTAGLMFLLVGAILAGCFFGGFTEPFAIGVTLFCVFLYLAIAAGVVAALYQRWKEIQGGEEDEAKKY